MERSSGPEVLESGILHLLTMETSREIFFSRKKIFVPLPLDKTCRKEHARERDESQRKSDLQ